MVTKLKLAYEHLRADPREVDECYGKGLKALAAVYEWLNSDNPLLQGLDTRIDLLEAFVELVRLNKRVGLANLVPAAELFNKVVLARDNPLEPM
jgi:hypothetical protein